MKKMLFPLLTTFRPITSFQFLTKFSTDCLISIFNQIFDRLPFDRLTPHHKYVKIIVFLIVSRVFFLIMAFALLQNVLEKSCHTRKCKEKSQINFVEIKMKRGVANIRFLSFVFSHLTYLLQTNHWYVCFFLLPT